MKKCKGCKRNLPLGKFYLHSGMKDGYLNFCKTCVCKRVRNYRLKNINKIRQYDRKRGKLPHRIALSTKITKKQRTKYPKKYKAQTIIGNAIRDGKLIKPSLCEKCHKRKRLYAHHENYNKPLQVTWLCQICHKQIHKKGGVQP